MMKRHALRPGMTVLTLSLLSCLTLLTACGGGGKGAGAPAAPAADPTPTKPVETPPEPTVESVTAADEPYIVSPSSVVYNPEYDSTPPKYQLNILDGKTRTFVPNGVIPFTEPTDNKWITTNKFIRTVETSSDGGKTVTEQDKGPTTLFFIDGSHKIQKVDLSRGSALSKTQVSNIEDACHIIGSYPLNKDGSETALIVSRPGIDGLCGKLGSAEANDNEQSLVASTDTTSTAPRAFIQPTVKILSRIYQDGILAGVLVQNNITANSGQLNVLSPMMDSIQQTSLTFPMGAINVNSFTLSPTAGHIGADWIANEPGETGSGFLRLQTASAMQLYKFKWDATTKAGSLSFQQSWPGVTTATKGLTGSKYIYFAHNNAAYRGPVAGTKPFELLYNLGDKLVSNKTEPLVPQYQTDTQLVFTQFTPATVGFAVPKTPGVAFKLFQYDQYNDPLSIIGQRGDSLVALKKSSFDTDTSRSVALINIATGTVNEADVHRISLLTPIWSTTRVNSIPQVNSLLVFNGTLASEGILKTVDFTKMAYGTSIGQVTADFADSIDVAPSSNSLQNRNILLDVKQVLYGNVVTRRDPWLLNINIPNSLKFIEETTP